MQYRDYLLTRLLDIVPTILGLTTFIFLLVRVLPGDPAAVALGPDATREQIENLRRQLWLDRPLYDQYGKFLWDLLNLRLGMSVLTYRDVSVEISRTFPATLELVLFSLFLAVAAGVPIGIMLALKPNRKIDLLVRPMALAGVALPRFFSSIMLQLIFSYLLSLLPLLGRIGDEIPPPTMITGLYLVDSLLTLRPEAFVSSLIHLILPSIALAVSPLAQIIRLVRGSMIEEVRKDYTLTLRANSLPTNILAYKYMLKNAFSATLTTLGLMFGALVSGAFIVESIFAWPGLARFGVRAVLSGDLNAIVGVTLVIGVVYSFSNFAVDLLYGYLNPRVAAGYGE